MEVITVDLARSIWLFNVAEMNPAGISLNRVMSAMVSRYGFKKFPPNYTDATEQNKGLPFQEGEFTTADGRTIGISVSVFNDGLVADSRSSTNDCDDFLRDLTTWLREEHKLSIPKEESVKVGHLSQLTVSTERQLASLIPRLVGFADYLSATTEMLDNKPRQFKVAGVSVWTEDVGKPFAPTAFRFEHKWGTTWDEHRYFTQAPLRTQAHKEALTKLEELLA